MDTLVRAFSFVQMFNKIIQLFVCCRLTTAEAPVELIEAISSCLPLDLVHGGFIHVKWLMINFITAGIGPTVTTIVITKPTQNPTSRE
jgi:hypothetical protein